MHTNGGRARPAMSFAEKALSGVKFMPFWIDDASIKGSERALNTDIQTDLLIVGGGFTGLWTAILAKEENPDRDVVLIEAGHVAQGASGRPGAIVSTSVMHGLSNAIRVFPNDLDELERLGHENMDGFMDAIVRYGIDCDFEFGGELTVGIGAEADELLDEEYELNHEHGHEVQRLDAPGTRAQVNSPIFTGAVWSKKRSGTVHPGKLAQGLKKAALSLGVRMYENSPLVSADDLAGKVSVTTPSGSVMANKVVLATNAFAAGHKRIKSRVALVRDRLLATEPLTDEQMKLIGWSNRQGIYDTRTQMNYMRLTKDNRIIFGGRLGYFFAGNPDPAEDKTQAPYVRLAEAFHRTFPQLADVTFSHAWSGPIGLTNRMAVHFQHYFGGKMIYAGGYSGFGVSASRFGARIGLAIADKKQIPELDLEFAKTEPGWLPPEPFRWFGAKATLYAMDTMDEKGGWRRPWIRFVEKLGFPLT